MTAAPQGRIAIVVECGHAINRTMGERRPRRCRRCYEKARSIWIPCDLKGCRNTIRRGKKTARRFAHHFCSQKHYIRWRTGKKHPSPRVNRVVRGREAARRKREREQPSQQAIAEDIKVSRRTVGQVVNTKRNPQAVTRYKLEQAGLFKPITRPPLADALLMSCLTKGWSLNQLAAGAGIQCKTLYAVIQTGIALRPTLYALANATGLPYRQLKRLARSPRRVVRHRRGRRRKAPSEELALEVHRLIHDEDATLVAAARRLNLTVDSSGHSRAADRAWRHGQLVCVICTS